MDIAIFNYLESLLWFGIAMGLVIQLVKQGKTSPYFLILIVSIIAFTVFGVSDIIEASTGAWWKPIGLLIFKGCCVCAFLWCFLNYRKIKSNNI